MTTCREIASRAMPQPTSRRRLIGGVLGAALGGRSAKAARAARSVAAQVERPNIILIVLDDLDTEVVSQMQEFQDAVVNQAATFANYVVTTPLCGPSRASLLRGQYAHNHGMLGNNGPAGGFLTFHQLGREESTLATWLQDAGYRTALVGKYLNGYPRDVGQRYIPPGWDEWYGTTSKRSLYYGFTLNQNGTVVDYGDGPDDYETDVLAAKATDFVGRSSGGSSPFFLYVAPLAPHAPATSAPRYAERFADVKFTRPPDHNEADVSDKPAWLREAPVLTDEQIGQVDENQRKRLRSLLPVLDLIAGITDRLRVRGSIENTYIFLTSDNGWFAGEHRLGVGKQAPYEESIRVPFMAWGAGMPAGQRIDDLCLNIDVAPTIAELAGVTPPAFVDGRSFAPLLRGASQPSSRQTALAELLTPAAETDSQPDVEGASAPGEAAKNVPPYRALRTVAASFVEYETGERELYDLRKDPFQLINLVHDAEPALLDRLSNRLAELASCAAETCRRAEDAPLDVPGIMARHGA
jgi:arylsulfatase A-like enzyme